MPSAWITYIQPFATAIGQRIEDVASKLAPLVGDPNDEAIALLQSENDTPTSEIVPLFAGLPTAKLKKAIATHLREQVPAAPLGTAQGTPDAAAFATAILPAVPDDDAWLASLKVGGQLKVTTGTVIAAIRAALADRSGLFEVPERLTTKMEEHAESLDEPVGEEFFKLRRLLTERSYAEVFAALPGATGRSFATKSNKANLITKLDERLWPALISFNTQLRGWNEGWTQSSGNTAVMAALLATAVSGNRGALPPGMMAPPPTDGLRDAAEAAINQINSVFGGFGIVAALALAYDAKCIRDALSNPQLPAHVGAANRDQMLKQLGLDVTADYVRLERSITAYALAIMEFPKTNPGSEVGYLAALLQLGTQIPWDKLAAPARRSPLRTARGTSNDEGGR
jgi:hypothetical protein